MDVDLAPDRPDQASAHGNTSRFAPVGVVSNALSQIPAWPTAPTIGSSTAASAAGRVAAVSSVPAQWNTGPFARRAGATSGRSAMRARLTQTVGGSSATGPAEPTAAFRLLQTGETEICARERQLMALMLPRRMNSVSPEESSTPSLSVTTKASPFLSMVKPSTLSTT